MMRVVVGLLGRREGGEDEVLCGRDGGWRGMLVRIEDFGEPGA
jgi:hypothetical protein